MSNPTSDAPKRERHVDEEAEMNAPTNAPAEKRRREGGGGGGRGKAKHGKRQKWEKTKYDGRNRNKEDSAADEEAAMNAGGSSAPATADGTPAAEDKKDRTKNGGGEASGRLPKRRAAVLVGYCGTGYSGMQIQRHGSKTIEGDIFDALVKVGAVSEENAVDHRKVDVQRSARTDAGVHAAGNVISLKMIVDPPVPAEFADLTAYVNSFLPPQIRMWGFVKAMKSFQARTFCDSRVYEYLLPSYCLLPPASSDPLATVLDETSPGWREVVKAPLEFSDAAPVVDTPEGEEQDPRSRGEFERRRAWRVDPDSMARFRALIDEYKGTHNFHNYTVGKPFNDSTVKRFMISLDVRDPAVYGDIEWISVRIHGQSFMLHQIRKMMSMAILACRTGTPPSLIPATFGPQRIHIPKAPPLGLLLEQPQFKTYNQRVHALPNVTGEERPEVDFGKYADVMHKFKVEWIYERLREVEYESNIFHKWIRQIDTTSSRQFGFLNTAGVIPEEATVTLTSWKYGGPGGQPKKKKAEGEGDVGEDGAGQATEGLESDDDEADNAETEG